MDITGFFYPHRHNQVMSFVGQNGSTLVRDRANRVYLDPITAEVVHSQYAQDLALVARISDTADPLHFGNFASGNISGLTIKLIYALFGLILTALVLGGMRMHYLRTQKRDPNTAKWLGITGLISLALSVAALVYTSIVFDEYSNTSTSLSPRLGNLVSMIETGTT
ncbi:MAG: Yip1 domain [Idiomarinaceae bacterium HL-53]|nr:MAG: Yip1 domain [Idiomarinaceae bacterium HL-53]